MSTLLVREIEYGKLQLFPLEKALLHCLKKAKKLAITRGKHKADEQRADKKKLWEACIEAQ